MKRMSYLFALFFIFLLTGCATKYSAKEFNSAVPIKNINGTYINHLDNLFETFHPKSKEWWKKADVCDLITLTFNGKDTLKVIYHTEEGTKEHIYRGKLKNGYFQFYYFKKVYPFVPVFAGVERERVRVGYDANQKMLVHYAEDGFGMFLVFMGKYGFEFKDTFYPIEQEPADVYIPFCIDNKWGYKSSNGTIFIEPVYDFARTFDEHDLARVKMNGKWGLIRKNAHYFLPAMYDKIGLFDETMQAYYVEKEKKIGYIDRYKKTIVPLLFEKDTVPQPFYESDDRSRDRKTIIRLNNKYGIINSNGILLPPVFDKIRSDHFEEVGEKRTTRYCKVSYNGETIYVSSEGHLYSSDLNPFYLKPDKKNQISVWDLPWDFQAMEVEPDDYLIPFYQDGLWGYKNTAGEIIIKPMYENVRPFDEQGLALVCYEGKWGNIRKNNRASTPFLYDVIYPYDNVMQGYRVEKDGLTGFTDQWGRIVLPVSYQIDLSSIYGIFQHYRPYKQRSIMKDGKYGFIDSAGILCPPVLDKILRGQFDQLQGYRGTYCLVSYNGKNYYLSAEGYLYPYKKVSRKEVELDEENAISPTTLFEMKSN